MTCLVDRYEGDSEPLSFPIVAHLSSTREAILFLRDSVERFAAANGGEAVLIHPSGLDDTWGIRWTVGPSGWADKYASDPESSTGQFSCRAVDGDTIFFEDRE